MAKLIVLFYFISFCIVCSLPFVYGGKCYCHYTVVSYVRRLMRGVVERFRNGRNWGADINFFFFFLKTGADIIV